MARLLHARGQGTQGADLVNALFGKVENSAKLLIGDALPDETPELELAWFQYHAEDEFAGGAYRSAKFDRIAVMQGKFRFKMVLEDASEDARAVLEEVLALAHAGQIGIGGGQWRGHGWVRWEATGTRQPPTQ